MKKFLFGILLFFMLLVSCENTQDYSEYVEPTGEISQYSEINNWILQTMKTYYYWNEDILVSSCDSLNPSDFFNSILYPGDKFSWVQNINQEVSNIYNYGFEYTLVYEDNTKSSLVGIVLYVYTESDTQAKGVKRGDIFFKINSSSINTQNYESLMSSEKAVFSFKRYEGERLLTFDEEIQCVRKTPNSIQCSNIYESDNFKIGYICYNQFSQESKKDLLECFKNFKQKNVNELVVDFRYNLGGLLELSVLFSSFVVPNVDTAKVALSLEYNQKLHNIYKNQGHETDIKFFNYPESYIGNNLKRIFFITGPMTASASEAVINALSPYMEVVLIGEKTFGKNYGSTSFRDLYNKNSNWMIQPIIMKIYNSKHESNYNNGFIPDYYINEFLYPLMDLGSPEEPLLSKAISIIKTGNISSEEIKIKSNQDPQFQSFFKYSIKKEFPEIIFNIICEDERANYICD